MRGACLVLLVGLALPARGDGVSFRNEVMPILSRAGCNQGACHGNLNGKGGFKLSLRGEDAAFDFSALTHDMWARRADPLRPAESLLLRKATGAIPHEGGPRFDRSASEYRILHRWIADGCRDDGTDAPRLTALRVTPTRRVLIAPADRVTIGVTGEFSDGSVRDLTHLAVFETTATGLVSISPQGEVVKLRDGELTVVVRCLDRQVPVTLAFVPPRDNFVWRDGPQPHPVDRHVFAQLQELRLTPSPASMDGMFLRRAFLDAIGVLPTAEESRKFLADPTLDKRERVIDGLLKRPEFADYWAQKWGDLLRNEEKALDRKGVRVFHQWIRDAISDGKPLNEFARELIAARGSTYQNPPANLYRSLREPYARAEAIAQVFLGIRIQCAKCHNHPFDRWTQTDYHEFAAVFGQIDYRVLKNDRRDNLDKHEFDGDQVVFASRGEGLAHPRTKEILRPRILDASASLPPDADPLAALAAWVADPGNPFFARAQANRVWFHLFGRGLVEPSDDFRATNPAANGPLLNELAEYLTASHFDLRALVRFIMTSRTYQFSSSPGSTNADDDTHCSKAAVRPLEAEQLLDAVAQVTGTRPKFDGYPRGTRAGQMAAVASERRGRRGADAERFLKVFGKPERLLTCECERSVDAGLMQAFTLLTGEMLQDMLTERGNRIGALLASGKSDAEVIAEFYLAALTRLPTPTESAALTDLLRSAKDRRASLEDVVWGLVNSKEFLLRR